MTGTTVQEIENAIAVLSAEELQELYAWLEQNRPQPIDVRIAADLNAGLLDVAIFGALDDAQNGRTQPF